MTCGWCSVDADVSGVTVDELETLPGSTNARTYHTTDGLEERGVER